MSRTLEIVVLIKNALNPSQIKIEDNNVLLDKSPRVTSEIDRNALEEALQLREKCGGKITTISIGDSSAKDSLIEALAMGVDDAILVNTKCEPLSGLEKAKILSRIIKEVSPSVDLVLLGEASVDNFSSQTGPRLSVELSLPYVSYLTKLSCEKKENGYILIASKSIRGFNIEVEISTPLILSVTREINRPRYVPFSKILKVSRQASSLIKEINVDNVKIDMVGSLKRISLVPYKVSRKKVIFEDSPEVATKKLIEVLEKEGVLP